MLINTVDKCVSEGRFAVGVFIVSISHVYLNMWNHLPRRVPGTLNWGNEYWKDYAMRNMIRDLDSV